MSPYIRLLSEMLAALVVAGLFLRELYSRPLIDSTRTWPLLVLVFIMVVAGLQVAAALWHLRRDRIVQGVGPSQEEWPHPGRRYALMAAFAAYVLALPHLGYAVASALFIPVGGAILGMPLTIRNIALGVAMAAGAYLLFVVAFEVPMPDGLLTPPHRWL
jgi:hypothetical protein